MKYLITITILITLILVTHTTFGIYNDNTVASIGGGNTHIGLSVGSNRGRLFYFYHVGALHN